MFSIVLFFLYVTGEVLSQGIFAPADFNEASCTGSNQWTSWFDSGDASISLGEFELTTHLQQIFPFFMCPLPIAIEVIIFI